MSRALITESHLTAIGDAIRAKLGVQTQYTPPQMAGAIASIPTGSTPNLQSKTATENGTVTPDSGYDGLSEVVVNVSGSGESDSYFSRLTPIHTDLTGGYINAASWIYGDQTSRTDIYTLEANKAYIIMLGKNVGNRFRTAFFQSDPAEATSRIDGTQIMEIVSVRPYVAVTFSGVIIYTPDNNGYLGIGKTNQGIDGILSYVFEVLF